jgi:hypothetical protein
MKLLLNFISLLFLLVALVFIMLRTAEGFGDYRGVARWDSKIYPAWNGTKMYPVSKRCNCPDNHNFVDNKCVSRDYPFKASAPFCYPNLE